CKYIVVSLAKTRSLNMPKPARMDVLWSPNTSHARPTRGCQFLREMLVSWTFLTTSQSPYGASRMFIETCRTQLELAVGSYRSPRLSVRRFKACQSSWMYTA